MALSLDASRCAVVPQSRVSIGVMTSQTQTTPASATSAPTAPLQTLQPVSDEKNLLGSQDAAGSCCGGSCCSN